MTRGYTTSWIDCSAMQPDGTAGLSRLENDSMSVFEFPGGILVPGGDRRFCVGATGKRATV